MLSRKTPCYTYVNAHNFNVNHCLHEFKNNKKFLRAEKDINWTDTHTHTLRQAEILSNIVSFASAISCSCQQSAGLSYVWTRGGLIVRKQVFLLIDFTLLESSRSSLSPGSGQTPYWDCVFVLWPTFLLFLLFQSVTRELRLFPPPPPLSEHGPYIPQPNSYTLALYRSPCSVIGRTR